jgi:hypothetical protein
MLKHNLPASGGRFASPSGTHFVASFFSEKRNKFRSTLFAATQKRRFLAALQSGVASLYIAITCNFVFLANAVVRPGKNRYIGGIVPRVENGLGNPTTELGSAAGADSRSWGKDERCQTIQICRPKSLMRTPIFLTISPIRATDQSPEQWSSNRSKTSCGEAI